MMSNSFHQPAGVYEDQGWAVLLRKLHNAGIDLLPHFIGCDRPKQRSGNFDGKIESALMADINDDWIRAAIAGQEVGDIFNRLLGGRESYADRGLFRQSFQAFERKRQVRAALVIRNGMYLINDHGFDIPQDGAALFRGEQNVQRLWRRDQNVRRALQHGPTLVHKRVASANGGANLWHQDSALASHLQNLAKWNFEVFLDIV